jgi:hypothetical protein
MRTDYAATSFDGLLNVSNWALIDFDRSEVFNLYVNGDGFLAFSGRATNQGGIGSNMNSGSNSNFDIAANGRAAGDTSGAIDTSLKVNDGNYHYVGVTYSVANQRIILWIDGVAKFVANGNGSLTALGAGAKRFGVIGDGSEAGTGTDENDYENPALNNQWFDGAISAIHLHEFEVCSDDVSIVVDDTNTNVTANKNATTVSTYPAKQYGTLSSIDLIRQESVESNYSGNAHPDQTLNNSLKLYYDFGIDDSYQDGTSVVNDISNFGEVDASIICDHCNYTSRALQFNPSQAVNPITSGDSIFAEGLKNQLGLPPAGIPQHTFVTWIKKDNFVNTDNSGQFVGYSYSTIFSYRTARCEEAQYLLIRQEDGALGRFMPIPSNQLGTYVDGINNTSYPRYPATGSPFITGFSGLPSNNMLSEDYQAFSTTNKITDNEWHMVALRANASGNGSIDISVDGGTWENIYAGSDAINADTFNFDDALNESRLLSLGSARVSAVSPTGFGFRVFNVQEDVASNATIPNVSQTVLPFSGELNSFYAYDKELSQNEITNLYNRTKDLVENGIIQGDNRFIYEIGYTGVIHSDVSSNTQYVEFDDLVSKPKLVNLTFEEKDDLVTGGRYIDKQGFASNINKLQDSNYWQDFSYEIRSGITSSKWINEFNNLVHPAGMKLFAALILKIFKDNEWDDHYIIDYYNLKRQLEEEQDSGEKQIIQTSIDNLEKEINSLYRLTNINADYKKDFSWIRDPNIDIYNPTGYGTPTYQPGYLYKEFATLTFLIEAFLTPTDNAVTAEEQYWINVGKNYFAHIVLQYLIENSTNIDERMYSQYALGQLKFIGEHGPMSQYGSYRLDQGALEETLNPEQPLKFTALNALVQGFGVDDITPYVRGRFGDDTPTSSAPSTTASGYDLSSREVDGDGTSYDNSSIDVERTDLGIL